MSNLNGYQTGWVVGDTAFIPDNGGSGGVVIVTGTINEETVTLGKTYSEIKADYMAGYTVVILVETEQGEDATVTDWNQVTGFNEYTGTDPQSDPAAYTVVAFDARFTATDPNGYPKQ